MAGPSNSPQISIQERLTLMCLALDRIRKIVQHFVHGPNENNKTTVPQCVADVHEMTTQVFAMACATP